MFCGKRPENPLILAEVSTKLPDSKTPFRETIFILLMVREREEVEGDGLSDSRAMKVDQALMISNEFPVYVLDMTSNLTVHIVI